MSDDPIYKQAKAVAEARFDGDFSIAALQQILLIGYNRAQRLMGALIAEGIVETYETGRGVGYRLVENDSSTDAPGA